MSLRQQAIADSAAIVSDVAGMAQDIKLTSPASITSTVQGFYVRTSMIQEPGTGLRFPGVKSAVTVPMALLASKGIDWATIDDGWQIETTDANGATIKGLAGDILPDLTIGLLTLTLRSL